MKLKFARTFSTKISSITFLLLLVSAFFIILYLNASIHANVDSSIDQITYENLNSARSELNNFIGSKTIICELLSQNSNLSQFLSKTRYINTNYALKTIDGYTTVLEDMNFYLSKDKSIHSISVWSKNRKEIFYQNGASKSNVDLTNDDLYYWYAYTLEQNKTILSSSHIDVLNGDYIFSILTPVKILNETTGIVSINFKISKLPFDNLQGAYILLDQDLNILKTTENMALGYTRLQEYDPLMSKNLLSSTALSGIIETSQNRTWHYKKMPEYNWYLVVNDNDAVLMSPLKTALILTNIMLLTSFLIISLLLFGIIKKALLPLGLLYKNIIEVSFGNFNSPIHTNGSDEIAESILAFNKMKSSLSKLIKNIKKISTTIHDSTSVLADDASKGSNAVDEISTIIQIVSKDAQIQVDETQNALFLSKSIGSKIDRMIEISLNVSTRLSITSETMCSAHDALDLLVQNAVVSELSIRTVIQSIDDLSVCVANLIPIQDSIIDLIKTPSLKVSQSELFMLLEESHQFIHQIYHYTLEIGAALDRTRTITSTLDYSIEDVIMHCDSTIDALIDVSEETEQLMLAIDSIANRKSAITDSLEKIILHSQSTALSAKEVVTAIESHTVAMKSIEHQISTLYKSSIKLNNHVSNFTLLEEEESH
ncbi:methyl-accepting chemotaxis protein [Fusibacter ferrireducens]|uniref:Methyl-accepting chemotaxis protein n=1 Tax=Fusibacter ferrireducens TaxID=2785058 RepID=A0ABR9ZV51_9FIRM|nr:methyl-accepting chemotaxis protein [Fusibacter ferrireducens]MBF4694344.1 methyl-accepting chemotaxis protein [Fusibacter ferrireducens]